MIASSLTPYLSLLGDAQALELSLAAETHKTALANRRETTLKTTGLVHSLLTQTIENFKKADAELDKQIAGLRTQNNQAKIKQKQEIIVLQSNLSAQKIHSENFLQQHKALCRICGLFSICLLAIEIDCSYVKVGIYDCATRMGILGWEPKGNVLGVRIYHNTLENYQEWCKNPTLLNMIATRCFKSVVSQSKNQAQSDALIKAYQPLRPDFCTNPTIVAMIRTLDCSDLLNEQDLPKGQFKGLLAAPELAFKAIEEQYPGIL